MATPLIVPVRRGEGRRDPFAAKPTQPVDFRYIAKVIGS